VSHLDTSTAHPRPEPFDRLNALSLIEGLGSKANPGLQDGVKSAAQYQPWAFGPSSGRGQNPGACPERSRRIRPV